MNEFLEIILGTEWWPLRLKLLFSTSLRDKSKNQQERVAKQCHKSRGWVPDPGAGGSRGAHNSGLKHLGGASSSP